MEYLNFVHPLLYLYGMDDPQYPWNMRLGGGQSWSEHSGEEKKLLSPGFEP